MVLSRMLLSPSSEHDLKSGHGRAPRGAAGRQSHTAALTIDSAGAVIGHEFHLIAGYDDASLLRDLTPLCLIGHPSVTVRRSTFESLGGMEDGLACAAPQPGFR